jgi:hypothetical protein
MTLRGWWPPSQGVSGPQAMRLWESRSVRSRVVPERGTPRMKIGGLARSVAMGLDRVAEAAEGIAGDLSGFGWR